MVKSRNQAKMPEKCVSMRVLVGWHVYYGKNDWNVMIKWRKKHKKTQKVRWWLYSFKCGYHSINGVTSLTFVCGRPVTKLPWPWTSNDMMSQLACDAYSYRRICIIYYDEFPITILCWSSIGLCKIYINIILWQLDTWSSFLSSNHGKTLLNGTGHI